MSDFDALDDLELKADALEQSLGAAAGMAASFDVELRRVRASFSETGQEVATLERGLSRGLRRAVDGVVLD
ncbi:MAG: phage tail tape measure protein, partial [Lentibacter algarum]|nr:phage tail tape measure protein [Lentibacter algarum]